MPFSGSQFEGRSRCDQSTPSCNAGRIVAYLISDSTTSFTSVHGAIFTALAQEIYATAGGDSRGVRKARRSLFVRGRRMGTPAAILGAKLVRSEVEHGKHHDQDAHAIAQRSRLFSSHHISSRSLGLVAWMPSYTPTTYPPDFHGVELAALGYARGTRGCSSVRRSIV